MFRGAYHHTEILSEILHYRSVLYYLSVINLYQVGDELLGKTLRERKRKKLQERVFCREYIQEHIYQFVSTSIPISKEIFCYTLLPGNENCLSRAKMGNGNTS